MRSPLKVSAWQGPEEQLSRKFASSLKRQTHQRFRSRRSLTHVSLLWCGCSRGRPHESSLKPHRMAGKWIAYPIEEAGR